MNETILIELRTEELPPKSLKLLSDAFAEAVFAALRAQEFATAASVCTPYATPRRLALTITEVAERQPDRVLEKKGPAVAGALDANGQPTRALEGFMRAAGVSFAQLHRTTDGKGEYFVARREQQGEELSAHLAAIVAQAVRKLPIPKVMRWGDSDHQFVRPVHSLDPPAWQPDRRRRGARAGQWPDDARAPLPVRRRNQHRAGGRIRGATRSRQGHRLLRRAPGTIAKQLEAAAARLGARINPAPACSTR
jgi:hypothetical protein